jgi:hypothetical protein
VSTASAQRWLTRATHLLRVLLSEVNLRVRKAMASSIEVPSLFSVKPYVSLGSQGPSSARAPQEGRTSRGRIDRAAPGRASLLPGPSC